MRGTQVLHRGELDTIQTNEDYDVAVLGEGLSKESIHPGKCSIDGSLGLRVGYLVCLAA
jgi:hypothetical protein